MNERRKGFSDLSAVDKANLFKFHLALQFVKRPNLNKDQEDVIFESISAISSDSYDITKDRTNVEVNAQSLQARAASVFERKDAFEIFASLGGDKNDVEILQKYQNTINIFSIPERKAFFRKLSSADMSNLWKVQMAYYLVEIEAPTVSKRIFF